jgi:hypothetical protein
MAAEMEVPIMDLGTTGGPRFQLGRHADLPVSEIADAWSHGLERAMDG